MSMYYSHLLVPIEPSFVFGAASMGAFLEAAARAGFVGPDAERFVTVMPSPDGAFSRGMSRDMPKTGTYRGPNAASWIRPESEAELREVLEAPANVAATVWSEFRPRRCPLLEIEALRSTGNGVEHVSMEDAQFDETYYVAITCWRANVPLSMSNDGHGESPPTAVGFGEPIDLAHLAPFAVTESPSELRRIEIDGIAAARSWVSVTFGKYVFPPDHLFREHVTRELGIALAVPELLVLAERMLGCKFRQTCAWG
jgi:hypothetical protein